MIEKGMAIVSYSIAQDANTSSCATRSMLFVVRCLQNRVLWGCVGVVTGQSTIAKILVVRAGFNER